MAHDQYTPIPSVVIDGIPIRTQASNSMAHSPRFTTPPPRQTGYERRAPPGGHRERAVPGGAGVRSEDNRYRRRLEQRRRRLFAASASAVVGRRFSPLGIGRHGEWSMEAVPRKRRLGGRGGARGWGPGWGRDGRARNGLFVSVRWGHSVVGHHAQPAPPRRVVGWRRVLGQLGGEGWRTCRRRPPGTPFAPLGRSVRQMHTEILAGRSSKPEACSLPSLRFRYFVSPPPVYLPPPLTRIHTLLTLSLCISSYLSHALSRSRRILRLSLSLPLSPPLPRPTLAPVLSGHRKRVGAELADPLPAAGEAEKARCRPARGPGGGVGTTGRARAGGTVV